MRLFFTCLVTAGFAQLWTQPAAPAPATLGEIGTRGVANMLSVFYCDGKWRAATVSPNYTNQDHGDDALTTVLYLRWTATHDPALVPIFAALAKTAVTYAAPCRTKGCDVWSDYPFWDSVAASETWRISGDPKAVNGHDKWRILITIFVVGRDPRFSGPAERGTKRSGGFWPRMVDSCLSALRR